MKREGFLAFLFPSYAPQRDLTEQQALERLEKAARRIVKNARWCSLSSAKVDQLRQPLAELELARRAKRSL